MPFDLGGGLGLEIGTQNGEARLRRDLFSIPSFGPAGELSLAYNSLDASTAGKFGTGWSSNLTQYLTFHTGFILWHRPDGGRVAFTGSGSTWTVQGGHYETLTLAGSEYTVTSKDQSTLVFESTGAGRLKRIANRYGKALTLAWSTSSATATDASSQVTTIAIDSGNNRITGVTDSAGRVWLFGYTGTGANSDLTTITDPASKVTTLVYVSHKLTEVKRNRIPSVGGPPLGRPRRTRTTPRATPPRKS